MSAERNEHLIARLRERGVIRSEQVAEAFRAVPRHWFLPGLPLEQVYADDAIVTRREQGHPTSSSSQPSIMAIMLEQLMMAPGLRTLEIGAGTGYNAALLAHLTGPEQVTTIEYLPEVAAQARASLAANGFDAVTVVTGDAATAVAGLGTFDRIIVTAGAWDIVPAWFAALRQGGVIVLPLSLNGPQAAVAFLRSGDTLVSQSAHACGFMPVVGAGAGPRGWVTSSDGSLQALSEWPDSLPPEVLWPAIERATQPASVPGLAEAALNGDFWIAIALAGWRVVSYGPQGTQASACFPPTGDEPILLRPSDPYLLAPPGSDTPARLEAALADWRAAGSPTIEQAQIEATPLDAPRTGEALVEQAGARTRLTKHVMRYDVTLGG